MFFFFYKVNILLSPYLLQKPCHFSFHHKKNNQVRLFFFTCSPRDDASIYYVTTATIRVADGYSPLVVLHIEA